MTETTFDEWAVVELLGHRRLAGRVREVQLAGAGFLRLDIPATPGHGEQTQFIAPGSVYALHPVAEDVAVAFAGKVRTPPVHRWELARDPWDVDQQAEREEQLDAAEVAHGDDEDLPGDDADDEEPF
jgi:hypothetical protein